MNDTATLDTDTSFEEVMQAENDRFLPGRGVQKLSIAPQNATLEEAVEVLNVNYNYFYALANKDKTLPQKCSAASTLLEEFWVDNTIPIADRYGLKCGKATCVSDVYWDKNEFVPVNKTIDCVIYFPSMINNQSVNIPVVWIESKRYIDSTMFGEVCSNFRNLREFTGGKSTYVAVEELAAMKDEGIDVIKRWRVNSNFFSIRNQYRSETKGEVGNPIDPQQVKNVLDFVEKCLASYQGINTVYPAKEKVNPATKLPYEPPQYERYPLTIHRI